MCYTSYGSTQMCLYLVQPRIEHGTPSLKYKAPDDINVLLFSILSLIFYFIKN